MSKLITVELEAAQLETYVEMFGVERADIISVLSNTRGKISNGYGHIDTSFVLVYMGKESDKDSWQEHLQQELDAAQEKQRLQAGQSVLRIRSEGGNGMLGLPPGDDR